MPDGGTVGDYTGPSDDNLIITANGGIPADPYCCAGPQLLDGGALRAVQLRARPALIRSGEPWQGEGALLNCRPS